MSKLLLLTFSILGGVFAAEAASVFVENGVPVAAEVIEQTPDADFENIADTSYIITAQSVISTQDTFSLSKHLEFFTPDYRRITEKYNAPETADSIYKMRLDSLGKGMAVPLVYNPKVKSYIKAYTDNKRQQVNVMLSLGQYYFPLFEEIFARYEIPSELKYLAIIESALNPRATSRVGASGLWQFMYQTGQMYNLKVNPFVDERFDPVKATEAAARYLRDLYRSFGDWTLVIAAYNCGPGNVNKAIRKAKGKTDFWKIYQFLPSETRNYVPAYIGATYAMNYYAEHNIPAAANDFPMLTDTVVVDKDMDFNIISQILDLPLQTLRDLNPQYKQDIIPGGSNYYSMRLPVYIIPHYLEMQDTMAGLFEEVNREIVLSYRIKQHETLSGIAARFDVSVKDLIAWNKLKSTTIYPNQLLQIHTTQKAIEAIRARPKIKRDERAAERTETLLASTTTKPKPTSSRQNVASQAVATTASTTTPAAAQPKSTARQATTQTTQQTRQTTTTTTAQTATTAAQTQQPQATTTKQAIIANAQAQRAQRMQQTTAAAAQTQPTQQQAKSTSVISYTIKRGDTLYAICRRHPGSNLQEIIRMNNLANGGNLIKVGQVIKIKIN